MINNETQNEIAVSKGFNYRKCCIITIFPIIITLCCCLSPIIVTTIIVLNLINELPYSIDNSTIYNDLNKTLINSNYSYYPEYKPPTEQPTYMDFEPYNEIEEEISSGYLRTGVNYNN